MQAEQNPLILTLRLDAESQAFFDGQRRLYFPPERNVLAAHLTLFHQLPDDSAAPAYLESLLITPFEMEVTDLMHLGAGVAYELRSAELLQLHGKISKHFQPALIPQDRQRFKPHVVIQNKVTPEDSKRLLNELKNNFRRFAVSAAGLDLWEYMGGPWRHSFGCAFKNM